MPTLPITPAESSAAASNAAPMSQGFDLSVLHNLTPGALTDAGFLSSHSSRQRLFNLFDQDDLCPAARMWVFTLATMLRSRARILQYSRQQTLTSEQEKACTFVRERCVQWVHEDGPDFFPLGRVPASCPSIAAFVWARLTMPARRTTEAFLQNTWAAHINLSAQLLNRQKACEMMRFGKRFNQQCWNRKAVDNSMLMDKSGGEFPCSGKNYGLADVKKWLRTFDN